ncbi:MAG TPA: hypothetical protein VFE16_14015 [Candidatus Cybelea sp.]|nr:hypothetical protein [Candidatus Cybelea sp.]
MFVTPMRRAVAVAASLAFIAGCSSGTPSLTPAQSTSVMPSQERNSGTYYIRGGLVERPLIVPVVPQPWNLPHAWPDKHHKKKKEILFVADPQNNQILMYDPLKANPTAEGSITNGIDYAFGLAIGQKGTLYVANLLSKTGSTGSITVYPKGKTSPSLTITTGCAAPYGIAIDSKGDVFSTNLNNDTITAYKSGAKSPYETINFSSYGQALGIGIDANDNAWVASDTNNEVFEIAKGSTTPVNAELSGLVGPINVAFGLKDVMYVSNFSGANVTVYTYGTKSPSMTITNGAPDPTLSGFTKKGYYFQSNQNSYVSGYKTGSSTPFSQITGIPDPRGIASSPRITL